MTDRKPVLVLGAVALAVLAIAGIAVGIAVSREDGGSSSPRRGATTTTPMGCNDWAGTFTQKECFAAGVLLTSFQNLQPAVPFCKWKASNPGEWTRLRAQAAAADPNFTAPVVSWQGASISDTILAYSVLGGPGFELQATLPKNACGGPIVKPPIVQGVTPGQTDATVTVTTTP